MSLAASEPALIGMDWGTSSLRAFLIGAQGEVLDRIAKPQGILHVENRDFETAFVDLIAGWRGKGALPVIASGMITSRNGWIETPYLTVPAGARELAAALVPLRTACGATVHFITGMTTDLSGAPDVMRGEETQIIGACADMATSGVCVLPGTHSKWLTVSAGQIADYATYMTGDVFGALRHHTILGALMADGPFHDAGFRAGVTLGLSSGARLLHDLFSVRTLPLFNMLPPEAVEDYLSGLLIGAEIGGVDAVARTGPVTIIGRNDLTDRYEIALGVAGMECQRAPDDIVARGHFTIARAAGLVA